MIENFKMETCDKLENMLITKPCDKLENMLTAKPCDELDKMLISKGFEINILSNLSQGIAV